jgi:hypothetical protein
MPEKASGRPVALLWYSTNPFQSMPALKTMQASKIKTIPKKIEFFCETDFMLIFIDPQNLIYCKSTTNCKTNC